MQKKEKKLRKDLRKKKWKSNRELYICSSIFLILFAGLFYYLFGYVDSQEEVLFNNSYNSRQSVVAKQNIRGSIFSSDGYVLAESLEQDGKEMRSYPYSNIFAHIVGYSDKGKTGIESLENYWLSNTAISEIQQAQNEADEKKNPGNNVYATLDTKVQQAAFDAMGVYQGAVVVTEVKTGRVLAMVSKPDYDPNQIAAIWEKVNEDTEKAVLLNRAVQGLYPPGSTFKIVTSLAYIRQNPGNWDNYHYQCSGTYKSGENKIQCYHGSVHNSVDLFTSFAKSCNCSFANIGMQLDRQLFRDTIDSLLFNETLPIELPQNISSVTLDKSSSDEAVIQTSIGQGQTQVTPMLLNMITQAVANKGTVMKQILVDRIESADGRVLKEHLPEVYADIMTLEEAEILTGLMEKVVLEGTGKKLKDQPYTAAGKTGSAEFNQVKEDSHAWFTGFAPVEDPQIAVTVLVEKIGSGGDYAVPLARRIFDAYFSE